MNLPVQFFEVLIDQIHFHPVGNFPQPGMLIPVDNIGLGRPSIGGRQQNLLNDILDFLNTHDPAVIEFFRHTENLEGQLFRGVLIKLTRCHSSFRDGTGNLFSIEFDQTTVPFLDLCVHNCLLLQI